MIRIYKGVRKEELGENAIAENPVSDPSETLLGYLPYLTLRDSAVAIKTWLQVWLAMLVILWVSQHAWRFGADSVGLDWNRYRVLISDVWAATPFWVWFPALLGFILWVNRGNTWVFSNLSAKACIGFTLIWVAILSVSTLITGTAALVFLMAVLAAFSTLEYFQDAGKKNYERLKRERHVDNN
jgi:hypothetical protein